MEEELNVQERPIPAEDIQPTEPLEVPQAPTSAVSEMASEIAAEGQAITAESERLRAEEEVQKAEKETEEGKSAILERLGDITGLMKARPELEEKAGIPGLREETAEIASQIEARELSIRRQIERKQKEVGLTKAQVDAQVRDIQRRGASELADLSIVLNAKTRRMDALQTSIDRRISLELEPLKLRLQFEEMFYQQNYESLNTKERNLFEARKVEMDQIYNERLQDKQAVGEIMKQAALFGASPQIMGEIANSRNELEALVASGNALGAGFQMEREAMDMQRESMEFNQSMAVQELNLKRQMYADSLRQRQEEAMRAIEEELIAEDEENESKAEAMLAIKQTLTGLDTHPGMSSAVGFGTKKSLIGSIPFVSGEAISGTARKDFEVQTTRLSNMFLVDNLDKMTGVLTDKDLEVLRSEGTTINDFDQSEESWLKEYQRIMDMVDRGLKEHGITTEQAKFYYGFEDSTIEGVRDVYDLNETSTKAFNPANFY